MQRTAMLMALLCAVMAQAGADQMTAMRAGCMGCHQPDKATVGPAIRDIAAKHKAAGNVDELVAVVKQGKTPEQLSWGTIPMPPSPASEADVRTVVEWMMTQ